MKNQTDCPNCLSIVYGNLCRSCGFKVNHSEAVKPDLSSLVTVTLKSGGTRYINKCSFPQCDKPGTMSYSTHHKSAAECNWLCVSHFR